MIEMIKPIEVVVYCMMSFVFGMLLSIFVIWIGELQNKAEKYDRLTNHQDR